MPFDPDEGDRSQVIDHPLLEKKDPIVPVPSHDGPQLPPGSLGTLVLLVAVTALLLLAAWVGLWALRRHRSRATRRVAASTMNGSRRGGSPKGATASFEHFLPDPSFGSWPISGDFLLEATGARPSGQ